jgi:hypothetical protein
VKDLKSQSNKSLQIVLEKQIGNIIKEGIMKKLILLVLVTGMCYIVAAEQPEQLMHPSMITPSLIDFSRLSMSHTVSFTTGISSNKQTYYQSLYTNHLQYTFSPKLKLNVDLNFTNFGTATYKRGLEFEGNKDNMSDVFPEFSLLYQPSENTSIVIEYRRINPYYINYNRRSW